jgi:hypothetical protein
MSAVNRAYSEEFREWAHAENARHDCYQEPSTERKPAAMFDSECRDGKCVVKARNIKLSGQAAR